MTCSYFSIKGNVSCDWLVERNCILWLFSIGVMLCDGLDVKMKVLLKMTLEGKLFYNQIKDSLQYNLQWLSLDHHLTSFSIKKKKKTDLTNFVERAVERRYNSRWVWNPWKRNKEWGATLSYSPLSGGTPETEWPVSNNIMARKLLNWFLLLLHVLSFYLQITIIACEIRNFWWSRWPWRTGTTA